MAAEALARARTALTDLLCNYAAFTGADVLLVFDAYRVPMNAGRTEEVDGIRVVYTAEGETADAYLEKYMHLAGPDYTLRLVTSDRLIQFSAVHAGVLRMSAREFLYEIQRIDLEIRARIQKLEKENP
ncbi:small GTP-binding protein domain [Clostridium sp. CAG:448]|nr:small GTP-binding protein domain [Clostridium sp. CAG:448]